MTTSSEARSAQKDADRLAGTEAIWKDFHDRVLAYLQHRIAANQDAEDMLQEVFLRIHQNLHPLRSTDSVASWVFRITQNVLTDHYRARAREAEVLSAYAGEVDRSLSSDSATASSEEGQEAFGELARCLEPLLRSLPDIYGETLALTEVKGMTQADAAKVLGLSLPGVKARVQRGRRKLKEILTECCDVELDHRRHVIDVERRGEADCGDCGCG